MDKDEIIAELRRVAALLETSSLTISQFKQYGRISDSTIMKKFGSWNEAIEAAGLIPIPSGPTSNRQFPSDDEYLQEIIRLTKEIGRQPSIAQMRAKGSFSEYPYQRRWGSLAEACKEAYAKYGFPLTTDGLLPELHQPELPASGSTKHVIAKTSKPQTLRRSKRVQYGEPMDFRGLRHAPINEQGVVYLFGMVSQELGFLIESVRTGYPDCEGKRWVDSKRQRLEPVLIEFEYQSRNFLQHGHDLDGCDLIVCWIHDWEECPIEVLELRSQIKYLPNQ